eukprot:GHRQ01015791.1.p2 GENE.GHRQ01015791.1~~GHRQ01015791.1.p2  ORF type:complete len:101 (-),score=24.85 GHRQ01015791.1:141-443(-)
MLCNMRPLGYTARAQNATALCMFSAQVLTATPARPLPATAITQHMTLYNICSAATHSIRAQLSTHKNHSTPSPARGFTQFTRLLLSAAALPQPPAAAPPG